MLAGVAAGQAAGKSGESSAKSADAGLAFSIESEMLTYRALEANSEAVACDVAAYLQGTTAHFRKVPEGSVCDVARSAGKHGIVMLPTDQTELESLQRWRAVMLVLGGLRLRAEPLCGIEVVERGSGTTAAATPAASGGLGALNLTPVGTMLGFAQTALGLFASDVSQTSVGGTIQDQALMNGVSRQLRSLSVQVLMPTTYHPYALTGMARGSSPLISGLDALVKDRECLAGKTEAPAKAVAADIDAFLARLNDTTSVAAKTSGQSGSQTGAVSQPVAATATSTAVTASTLLSLLPADALAVRLGIDPATGMQAAGSPWQHLLLVKALESGGAVTKTTSLLGSKIRYSGGSVATYSLFTADGELECSGNVFDYGGTASAKKFQKDLRKYTPDPGAQFLFQRGACRAAGKP